MIRPIRLAVCLLALLQPLAAHAQEAAATAAPAGVGGGSGGIDAVIDTANVCPQLVAVSDLTGGDGQTARVGADMARVITNNLQRSGLFATLPAGQFPQSAEALRQGPRMADWKPVTMQHACRPNPLNLAGLVAGTVTRQADGRLRVEFRLWDPATGQQLTGFAYTTVPGNWRRIAHIVSDAIYKRMTGEEGYFDTRLVYVAESGPATNRVKRLAIMDQDGENQRMLTDGRVLVLTPRFSPTSQEITYLAYYNNVPRVYLFNIDSGRVEVLGNFPNMTFAPRFSPDGNKVIMTLASDGNSDIHTMDLRTRRVSRLTNSPGIDTGGSFSPDGSRIVFESDRGGTQQVYIMNADGSNPTRLTFGQGRYGSPVWSPRGDYIAFTRMSGGRFYLGVIRPDGTGERMLTPGEFHIEGPTWAPNGRVLAYFKERGRASIYTVDITGRNEQRVITPTDASDPAWSPLIP